MQSNAKIFALFLQNVLHNFVMPIAIKGIGIEVMTKIREKKI